MYDVKIISFYTINKYYQVRKSENGLELRITLERERETKLLALSIKAKQRCEIVIAT